MLTEYIQAAMRHARYEILEDGTYYGEILDCPGVYAQAATLEGCRDQLREVLEDWIVLGLRVGHAFPVIDGISLGVEAEAA
jgi:predicted RNase H-like HicB family nuclease